MLNALSGLLLIEGEKVVILKEFRVMLSEKVLLLPGRLILRLTLPFHEILNLIICSGLSYNPLGNGNGLIVIFINDYYLLTFMRH
jgi:hypothetical protein